METVNRKSAIVFGATGLVGSHVLEQLLPDERYEKVQIFVRRPTGITHPKLTERVIDFGELDKYRDAIQCDDLFCCLGTTIKAAGSEKAFRLVDLDWVSWCAKAASGNGVKNFLVISSLGADPKSLNFYYRTKGEMEKAVSALKFERCVIFRPSLLLGKRHAFRFGEMTGKIVMQVFGFMVPAKYKAIGAEVVAKAMIKAANDQTIDGVVESDVIRKMR